MKKVLITSGLLAISFIGFVFSGVATAGNLDSGNNECPVGLVTNLEFNDEFGPGTGELTRCIDRRDNVKVVIQINKFCRDSVANADCTRPYALGNITNMIKDYEITHGMIAGKDYEIVAVVHSGGGDLILKDSYAFTDTVKGSVTISNQFQGAVEGLMSQGVRFLFCQNTTRGFMKAGKLPSYQQAEGSATDALIPGVEYVTAGVTAIADFQSKGYRYIQP